jgi:hypothetical protein
MERRALVLDANILIRAVLGQRVRRITTSHFFPNQRRLTCFRAIDGRDRLGRTRLLLDPIWTLCPGPVGAAMERSHAANQRFGTLDTAADRLQIV